MNSKGSVLAIGAIGIVKIIFTITAFFLLDIEYTATNIWALLFLLQSEAILFAGLIYLRFTDERYNGIFLKAGLTTSLGLYFIATLLCSIFAGAFRDNLNWFILIQIAIISLFVIVTIALFAFSRSINRRNAIDIAKVGTNEPKRGGF